MTKPQNTPDPIIILLGDALLRVWRQDLQLSSIVLNGRRDLATAGGKDPSLAVSKLDMTLAGAMHDGETPEAQKAKLQLVEAALHVWARIPRHVVDKIFGAIRFLAIARGENPDLAIADVVPVVSGVRNLDDLLAEKGKKLVSQRAAESHTRAQAERARVRRQMDREVQQGL